MMKPEECNDCSIFQAGDRMSAPMEVDYRDFHTTDKDELDVLFVGHAFNKGAGKPFEGKSGEALWEYIKYYSIAYYGITNLCKCRVRWAQSNANAESKLGERCKKLFLAELKYNPKLVVTLGPRPTLMMLRKNVGEMPNYASRKPLFGQEVSIITLPHPFSLDMPNLEIWTVRWPKLAEFLGKEANRK